VSSGGERKKSAQGQKFREVVPINPLRRDTGIPLAVPTVLILSGSWTEIMMWNLFSCYLSGNHDFGVRCEPGEIYLRCIQCGRRSPGWALKENEQHAAARSSTTAATERVARRKTPAVAV